MIAAGFIIAISLIAFGIRGIRNNSNQLTIDSQGISEQGNLITWNRIVYSQIREKSGNSTSNFMLDLYCYPSELIIIDISSLEGGPNKIASSIEHFKNTTEE